MTLLNLIDSMKRIQEWSSLLLHTQKLFQLEVISLANNNKVR